MTNSIPRHTHHYLDIETAPYQEFFNPEKPNDKSMITDVDKMQIITIQTQPIASDTGKPIGDLEVYRAWESSERDIVEQFYQKCKNKWFVFVGNNLNYEMRFLIAKFKKFCGINFDPFDRPTIDVQPTMVGINSGVFKGYAKILGKNGVAANIGMWYHTNNYNAILDYIAKETESFLDVYSVLCESLPLLKPVLEKKMNISEMDDYR